MQTVEEIYNEITAEQAVQSSLSDLDTMVDYMKDKWNL